MINGILSFIINTIFDINDSITAKGVKDIKSNVVEMVCVCTDDLNVDLVSQYCKSLEVVYATLLRASVQSVVRNRGNSDIKSIFKSLPLLTNSDEVIFDKELNSIASFTHSLWNMSKNKKAEKGGVAVSAFLESLLDGVDNIDVKFRPAMEGGDIFLKETRGGVPTFIEAVVTITMSGGKPVDKVIPLGVSVRPKMVSPQEMCGFFIKQNNKLTDMTAAEKVKAKKLSLKSLISAKRIKSTVKDIDSTTKRDLSQILESTKNVNKPFVCLLMSGYTCDILKDAKVDIRKPTLLKQVYNTLPIMSIGIYDMNVDMIEYSLLKDSTFSRVKASLFNTDVSELQKTLAEGLNVSRMLN